MNEHEIYDEYPESDIHLAEEITSPHTFEDINETLKRLETTLNALAARILIDVEVDSYVKKLKEGLEVNKTIEVDEAGNKDKKGH